MISLYARYAPLNHAHIPSFPNHIPNVDWKTCLPKFKNQKNDDASLHLVRFHMHINKLGVTLHEDSLMKIFMVSLEGDARSWYEGLPSEILCSLTDFHTVFHGHFKDQYPSLLLVQDCCMHDKGFIEQLKNMYGEEDFMDDAILEILHEYSSQK